MDILQVFIYTLLTLGLYFAPSILASYRKHRNELAITVTNLLLGWTGIGFIICLIWACTNNTWKNGKTN